MDASERTRLAWVLVDLMQDVIDDATEDRATGAVLPAHKLEVQIPELLNQGGARDAQALVVVTGPGSLTGVRVAVAACLGVGAARGIPVYGVGALEVAAFAVPSGEVLAVRSAGRGGLWVGRYRHHDSTLEELDPPARVDEEAWRPAGGVAVARIPESAAPGTTSLPSVLEPLARAARLAVTRDPLDVEVFDPATGRRIDGRL